VVLTNQQTFEETMLSKSAARKFFLAGTVLCAGAFVLLTVDSINRIPKQTHAENLTPESIHGKHLFEESNCMGCHTILGEGAYYAPELTKVYERRGPEFIKSMLRDPSKMYPGGRRMQKYKFSEAEINDLVAFLKWIGEMDLNGFPPKPDLAAAGPANATAANRPALFAQVCIACHSLGGSGASVGPALDGVGSRRDRDFLVKWLKDPAAVKPGTQMPNLNLPDADIQALADFLSSQKEGAKL
jgi:nitric oxide reductase subunit C